MGVRIEGPPKGERGSCQNHLNSKNSLTFWTLILAFVNVKIERICGRLESPVCSSLISSTRSQFGHAAALVVLSEESTTNVNLAIPKLYVITMGIDVGGRFFSNILMHVLTQQINVIAYNFFISWSGYARFCRQLKERKPFVSLSPIWLKTLIDGKVDTEYYSKLAKADIHGKITFTQQHGQLIPQQQI
ncbi:hypothetical protein VNO77_34196 [Canavalia gladiata]|uniref:Uncharacterized protein n=1 Tax=Canavalia gladiata TaxID=3824 RepID=A0AAN9KDU2_CANGL